jgi:hypothetical protein
LTLCFLCFFFSVVGAAASGSGSSLCFCKAAGTRAVSGVQAM